MSDVTEYSVTVENSEYVVDIGDTPITTSFTKAKKVTVSSGAQTATWTFATALTGATSDYIVQATVQNTSDSFPQALVAQVTSFSINTVVVTLSAPTDTANYAVNITVGPAFDP